VPTPSDVASWMAGNDILYASGTNWRLAELMFPADEIARLAPPSRAIISEEGPDYWRRLEAQHTAQEAERRQKDAALLTGQWIRASEALKMLAVDGSVEDSKKTLLRYAATKTELPPSEWSIGYDSLD